MTHAARRGCARSLYLRDDDYRLSFLQGNFVTLTNLGDDDVAERIVSPARCRRMNVSLHAVSPRGARAASWAANAARGHGGHSRRLHGGRA